MNNAGLNVVGFNTIFKLREEEIPLKDGAGWITPRLIDDLPKLAENINDKVITKISGMTRNDAVKEVSNFIQSNTKEAEEKFSREAPAIRIDVFKIVFDNQRERFLREEEELFLLLLALLTRKRFL